MLPEGIPVWIKDDSGEQRCYKCDGLHLIKDCLLNIGANKKEGGTNQKPAQVGPEIIIHSPKQTPDPRQPQQQETAPAEEE